MDKTDLLFDVTPNFMGLLDAEERELNPFTSRGYNRVQINGQDFYNPQYATFQNRYSRFSLDGELPPSWPPIGFIGFFLTENLEELPMRQKYPIEGGSPGLYLTPLDTLQVKIIFEMALVINQDGKPVVVQRLDFL